ncbi:MAG: hypothetical protein DRJ64_08420, partial [Thermoprotei archaeon]
MRKTLILLFGIIFFTLFSINSLAATPISDCTTINESGEYYLTNDIYFNTSGYCFNINGTLDNITIDFMGHTLHYNTDSILFGGGYARNITIKNGTLLVEYLDVDQRPDFASSNIIFVYQSSADYFNSYNVNITH